ncbi:MAG: phosphotransferase [Dehalococcoidia bacterium]
MDLQPLFDAPIVEQRYVDRDYSGYGNDVWFVRTATEHVIVRVSARSGAGGAFWTGLKRLFGIDAMDMDRLRTVSNFVNDARGLRAPSVLRTGVFEGRSYAITELAPGRHVDSFDHVPAAAAEAFGVAVAQAHQRTFGQCGCPGGTVTYPAAQFHERVAGAIDWLAKEYREADERDRAVARDCARMLREMPPARTASLVLIDIGGSQYLWDDNGPTAVVDTEAFVFAPKELELIVLESDNGYAFNEAFRRGYETVSPLPRLRLARAPYRCLIALLEVNGRMSLDDALSAPVWLDDANLPTSSGRP